MKDFILEKLKKYYSDEEIKLIEEGYEEKYVSLRVNNLKSNIDKIKKVLSDNDIIYEEVSWFKDALIIKNVREDKIQTLDIYKNGEVYLQSLSSMIPPLLLDLKDGDSVLDMCSAPGGKTSEIASINENVYITGIEKNKIRYEKLKYNLDKMGVRKCTLMNIDALSMDEYFSFDKILLDTPCSGTGTLDIVNVNEGLINSLVGLQLKLLEKAISMLKVGGILVYSTCSILKEENEFIVDKVNKGNIEILPITGFDDIPKLTVSKGMGVLPNKYYEGFYVIKLKKIS